MEKSEVILRHHLFRRMDLPTVRRILESRATNSHTLSKVIAFYQTHRELMSGHIAQAVGGSEFFPYALIKAVCDDRTCAFCKRIDGKLLKTDSQDFLQNCPPYCLGCRTAIISMNERTLEKHGIGQLFFDGEIDRPPVVDICNDWIHSHGWR